MTLFAPARFDALVLGGGPAGCACARGLARAGRSVALLERSRYADDRVGDTLAPEVSPWLARLDVAEEVGAVPAVESPGVISLWGGAEPGETDFLFNPYGPGRHVDRLRLDAALADAAATAGVTVLRGFAPARCRRMGAAWEVEGTLAGQPAAFSAPWVIDATGRAAWLARRQGVKPMAEDRLVAVVARVQRGEVQDDRLALEAVPDGWWYTAPLPGGRAVAAFLTDSDLLPRGKQLRGFWDAQSAATRLVGPRFRMPAGTTRLRVVAADTRWAGTVAGPGWLAVGDAALAHDPLSGSGIRAALASGCAAARTVTAADAGEADALAEYQRSAEAGCRSQRAEQLRAYGQVNHWRERPFWGRRSPR